MNIRGIANLGVPFPSGRDLGSLFNWAQTLSTSVNVLKKSILQGTAPLTPSGMLVLWAEGATEPPEGYYLCDGSAVSRTRDERIFAIHGTTFGSGDGSTTFNLPDNASLSPPTGLVWIIKQ